MWTGAWESPDSEHQSAATRWDNARVAPRQDRPPARLYSGGKRSLGTETSKTPPWIESSYVSLFSVAQRSFSS